MENRNHIHVGDVYAIKMYRSRTLLCVLWCFSRSFIKKSLVVMSSQHMKIALGGGGVKFDHMETNLNMSKFDILLCFLYNYYMYYIKAVS